MLSKCPNEKCKSNFFEIVEQSPTNASYKVLFVQCSLCGTPIGVMELMVNWKGIEKLDKKIDDMSDIISDVEARVIDIQNKINR